MDHARSGRDVILIAGAFLATAMSGAAGYGGALLLLTLLTRTVGVAEAVPLLTIAQLAGYRARAGSGYQSPGRSAPPIVGPVIPTRSFQFHLSI